MFIIPLKNIIIYGSLVLFGVWAEKWLVKRGLVGNNTYIVIFVAMGSILIKEIWYPTISWWPFMAFTVLAMILGANRGDLWTTMNKGRWWWKTENRDSS